MENIGVGAPPFADFARKSFYPSQSVWDFGDLAERSSLGFMELLGLHQDFSPSSLFDTSPAVAAEVNSSTSLPPSRAAEQAASKLESSCTDAVANPPATPNSSSISSASSEAVNEGKVKGEDDEEEEEEEGGEGEGEEQQQKRATKKQLKTKKMNQKREREQRVAFMTKSEVDHLEDGYRWRKYGQKAVKNSPFPRSYYRCTTATCNVKKRVERSSTDTSIVVTTYEGQHSHPTPLMPFPSFSGVNSGSLFSSAAISGGIFDLLPVQSSTLSPELTHCRQQEPSSFGVDELRLDGYDHDAGLMVKGHGLLQDVVPSHMLKYG